MSLALGASFEVDHLPEANVGSGKIVGFADHSFEEIQKHSTPLVERAGEFAAVSARKKEGNRGGFGKN